MTPRTSRRAVAVLICSLAAVRVRAEVTFFVSPTGDDAAVGTEEARPFRTVTKARDAVRSFQQKNRIPSPPQRVTVMLRGGTHTVSEPLMFGPEDSGSAAAPVTWAAFGNEKPVLSGGVPVSGWETKEINGKTAWIAKVPARANVPASPLELWVGGQRRTLARFPNEGYLRVADVEPGHGLEKGHVDFKFNAGDLKAWPSATQAVAVVYNRWVESHMPVSRIDEAASRVFFSKLSVFGLEKGDLYYLEGAADFLDQPGEWHFDRQTSTLTYLPLPGEAPDKLDAVVPVLTRVLVLSGQSEKRQLVSHVTFRGITFSHSEYTLDSPGAPADRGGWPQAATGVPGVVEGYGVRNCTFDNCTFTNAGNYGLVLGRGAQSNVVSRCTFTNLGAGGVRIGELQMRPDPEDRAAKNEVADSRIFECGLLYPSCVGIQIGQSSENRIHHNEIFDLPYTGVSIGWTWGYEPTQCHGNVVEHNHVHHLGARSGGREALLSDMGGVYTLGHQPGAVIRFNRFHDIAGRTYGGWGLYTDEGSRDILMEKNVVYRTTHGGFHQHYGRDNVVRNNVFAFARDQQVLRSRAEDHRSFTFERNIVYWDKGEAVMGQWTNFNAAFDKNVWWRVDGKQDYKIGYVDRGWWQKQGLDVNSVFADPLLVDPAKDDFNVKPDSPAIKLGFETWDQADVGPRRR